MNVACQIDGGAIVHDVAVRSVDGPAIAVNIVEDHVHDLQLHAVIFGVLLNEFGVDGVLRLAVCAGLNELRIARPVA